MSYLIEALGCGLVGDLYTAIRQLLPPTDETSIELLTEQVHRDKRDVEAKVRLACALMTEPGNDNIGRARDLFTRVVQVAPKCAGGHIGLACAADRLGHNGAAEHHLTEALRLRHEDPILMFSLAMTYEKLERWAEAERLYEDALRVCPALRNARERLAALEILNGNLAASARHYRLLAVSRPDRLGPRLIQANLLLASGEVASALPAFEEALTIEADHWESESEEASQLAAEGRFEDGVEWLQRALEDEPNNADLYLHLGDMLVKLGQDRQALEAFLRAVELCPGFLEAYVRVGTHYLRLGRYGEASNWFARAVDINDRLLVGYTGLAVAQYAVGDAQGGEETLDMAASIEPNSTLLFSEAARLGLKSGKLQSGRFPAQGDAEGCFDSVAQLAVQAGSVSDVLDLLDALIDRTNLALEHHPNHARLHYQLGLLLRNRPGPRCQDRGTASQAGPVVLSAARVRYELPGFRAEARRESRGNRRRGQPGTGLGEPELGGVRGHPGGQSGRLRARVGGSFAPLRPQVVSFCARPPGRPVGWPVTGWIK